jgi:hypothetical protein
METMRTADTDKPSHSIRLGVGVADTDLAEFVLIYQCLCCYNFSQEYTTKYRKIQDVS